MGAAIPRANRLRLRQLPPGRVATIPIGVRAAYGIVAAVAVWLLLRAVSTPDLTSAQAANQIICAALLLVLATAVGSGLCRIPAARYACTLTGAWAMLSPLFLPGAFLGPLTFACAGAFLAAGWAAETLDFRGRR
jgi:hypothetical protein